MRLSNISRSCRSVEHPQTELSATDAGKKVERTTSVRVSKRQTIRTAETPIREQEAELAALGWEKYSTRLRRSSSREQDITPPTRKSSLSRRRGSSTTEQPYHPGKAVKNLFLMSHASREHDGMVAEAPNVLREDKSCKSSMYETADEETLPHQTGPKQFQNKHNSCAKNRKKKASVSNTCIYTPEIEGMYPLPPIFDIRPTYKDKDFPISEALSSTTSPSYSHTPHPGSGSLSVGDNTVEKKHMSKGTVTDLANCVDEPGESTEGHAEFWLKVKTGLHVDVMDGVRREQGRQKEIEQKRRLKHANYFPPWALGMPQEQVVKIVLAERERTKTVAGQSNNGNGTTNQQDGLGLESGPFLTS